MIRVMQSVLALVLVLVHGASIQEGLQPPANAVDITPVAVKGTACPIGISKLQSEKIDDGWRLHISLTNASDFDASLVELHFFAFAAEGPFLRVSSDYVDTADLPVPAHGTKDTTAAAPALKDGEHLRVGAIVPGDSECDAARMKKAALAAFEPADLALVKAEGTPFRVIRANIAGTPAQSDKAGADIPARVTYTVEDSAPDYATDNVRVAVIAFVYTEGLGGFAVFADAPKTFASGRRVTGVVNLNLSPLPDRSSRWKFAVMPTEGFFDGHRWSLPGGKAGRVAAAALYNARR